MYKLRVIFVVLISAIFLLKCDIGESNPVANNENSRNKITGITGTVQDNQGTAIAEVNVTAYPGESTAKTTGKGEFILENLYSGIGYRLHFSKDGYCDTSIEVINLGFNSIDTLPFEIKMSPRSSSGDFPVTDIVPDTPKTVLPSAFELIDDFEDGDSISKLNTKWYTAKDFSYQQVDEENYGNTVWKPCNESTEITANLAFKGRRKFFRSMCLCYLYHW